MGEQKNSPPYTCQETLADSLQMGGGRGVDERAPLHPSISLPQSTCGLLSIAEENSRTDPYEYLNKIKNGIQTL